MISIILSSRSLIHSSALFILLFIAFSSAFISVNEGSNFSWFLFIVSSSFLQQSAFLLIAFLVPSVFSLSPFWILSLLDWRGLFQCLFFQGNSLDLLIGSGSFASSFCLSLFLYDFRRNNFLLWSWRAISMWERPCVACVGLMFFDVSAVFLACLPAASFLTVCWPVSPW